MGDDPFIPELKANGNGSVATGGSNYAFHYGLSKGQQLFVVVAACLALGLSVGAVIILCIGRLGQDKLIEAAERRAMDRATIAEREARIVQDKLTFLQVELAKKGIVVNYDDHNTE